MNRRSTTVRAARTWTWLVMAFLNLPIVIVIAISFSDAQYLAFPPPGLSLRWYEKFFATDRWIDAAFVSFQVAVATIVIAVPLGVAAAFGLVRGRLPGRRLIDALIGAPLIVPTVVAAVAFYFFFARIGLVGTIWAVILAHVALTVPLITVTVGAALAGFDQDLERAAQILGASRWRAFWHVTRPIIQPSIASGALFAFLMSFDELVVALFVAGVDSQTLPIRMWGSLRDEIDPTIAAISTLLILLSALVIFGAEALRSGRGRAARPETSE
jgi:putative spermidine/putrescine transport system permease protein